MALLDNGAQINTTMPKYVSDHSLKMGPITDLLGIKVACMGLGNAYMKPIGYIIIQVQVDRVQGYDEDQIALIIPDLSNFAAWISVILGTPTISQVVNVMKEVEIDALAMPWVNARVAHLLSVCKITTVEVGDSTEEEPSSDGYDQVMFMQNVETVDAFSSCMVPVKAGRAYTGEHINIMVQALQTKDSSLLQGLTVQNTYTELRWGSKKAVMVVRNSTAYPQTFQKKTLVASLVVAHTVPKPPMGVQLQEGGDEPQDPHTPKLTVKQWHGKLFNELDLSGLDSLPPGLADVACQLLAKYHDMFPLDPAELGCTHSTEHMIKVMDDTPFKEWFGWVPLPLVEEVWNHLQEMLESGAIPLSQSTWCNMGVLVRKKDGGLQFCIDFFHLNTCTKKDSYPLPRIQEALESLVGAGHFSCLDLKSGFWQIKMEEALKQYTNFTLGNLGFFECDLMPFGLCNVLAIFQRLMQNCLGKLNFIYCLI